MENSARNHHRAKFSITNPFKFWSKVSQVSMSMLGMKLICKYLNVKRLFLLNVEAEPRFSVYPTSHLYVVLHFLILLLFNFLKHNMTNTALQVSNNRLIT